jgi:hypothetical protein
MRYMRQLLWSWIILSKGIAVIPCLGQQGRPLGLVTCSQMDLVSSFFRTMESESVWWLIIPAKNTTALWRDEDMEIAVNIMAGPSILQRPYF